MKNFGFLCKTYKNDLKSFDRLVKSFLLNNKEKIEMYVSCPECDLKYFKLYENDLIHVISDCSYAKKYMTKIQETSFSIGYLNQEVCKLAFWETGYLENYLCLDSDGIFIRDFYYKDFMYDDHTPYSVLVMDKDLKIQEDYKGYWDIREQKIKEIFDAVDNKDIRMKTCHGFQIMNYYVLSDFKTKYLEKNQISYYDCIKRSPFEFTWYNAWLQKCEIIPVISIEPLFCYFHNRSQYILSRWKNITLDNYKRAYVGIILNSNWNLKGHEYKNPNIMHRLIYKLMHKLYH